MRPDPLWVAGVALMLSCCLLPRPAAAEKRPLPESLKDRDLFCETCYATVCEMYRLVKESAADSLEQRIDGALQRVCSASLLGRYAFPADLLEASCRDLIVRFENDLGLGLLAAFQPGKKPRIAGTVKDICLTRMKACKKSRGIPSLRKLNETATAQKVSAGVAPETDAPPRSAPGDASERAAHGAEQDAPVAGQPATTADANTDTQRDEL
ncbi:uncharacterized protein LOC119114003 [Pollicipes pollicipes]|uniref:uncharacterized protein LOC119114003 n=1 Tax=Pollicipes pollicipes TaxID=41117 RepID=UPI001884CAA7|nr:uncharacterized protein LOC119114003 [Pollicipes pollicipes]